ncbi:hypothetical protein HDU84_009634 [Entophlyctis sp. JEL0112]|nr:hypothetical protein HDU84_009634 [Entophlyctis sp. JEL0112]
MCDGAHGRPNPVLLVDFWNLAKMDKDSKESREKDKDKDPSLTSQSVTLRIDFDSQRILGVATLTFSIATGTQIPQSLRINCRLNVLRVSVNSVVTTFSLRDPTIALNSSLSASASSPHSAAEFREKWLKCLDEADEGELTVSIPADLPKSDVTFLAVRVEYEILDPKIGAHFVFPKQGLTATVLQRTPYFYTSNSTKSARYWTPCLDSPQQKSSWLIEIHTPKSFANSVPEKAPKKKKLPSTFEVIAQTNGSLLECYIDPKNDNWKVSRYSFDGPVCASSILIVAGSFEYQFWGSNDTTNTLLESTSMARIAGVNEVPDEEMSEGEKEVKDERRSIENFNSEKAKVPSKSVALCEVFYNEGLFPEVQATVDFLPKAMEFFESYTGTSYPFPSFKIVFLDDCPHSTILGAGIVIVSSNLLLDEDDIENVYESRTHFSKTLARQWFGQYVTHRNWTDVWLTLGLSNYIAGQFIRKLLGNNEYRYRADDDVKRCAAMDVGQLPLCPAFLLAEGTSANAADPLVAKYFYPDEECASTRTEFLSLKASLVIGMLDQRLGKGNLPKVINKIMISAMSGELENGMSTNHFFKACRKISANIELKSFADQWIFGSGNNTYFHLKFYSRNFLRLSEILLAVQVQPEKENTNKNHPTATKKFTGPFVVRVHEPKGTAYSHQIMVDEMEKVVEIPYHTKYKRAGQKLKKLQKMGIIAENENEDEEFREEFQSQDKDKGKPDLDQFDRRSLDWVRWDPEGDWLCLKIHDQLKSMWIEQLSRDNDVVAHREAILRLGMIPDNLSILAIARVLIDQRYFYRLRMDAAFSLAKLGQDSSQTQSSAFGRLFAYFSEKYCFPKASQSPLTIPRPNDFSEYDEYFVKKAVCVALVTCRNSENKVLDASKNAILNLLQFNDNSQNEFSDSYYISSLINALCHCTIPQKAREFKPKESNTATYEGVVEIFEFQHNGAEDEEEIDTRSNSEKEFFASAVSEVSRYLALDRLAASHQNVITKACLKSVMKWMMAGYMPVDLGFFLGYSGFGNFVSLRCAAIDALLFLDTLYTDDIFDYFLRLVEFDRDSEISYYTAKELHSFAVIMKALNAEDVREKRNYFGQSSEKHSWSSIKSKINRSSKWATIIWRILRSNTVEFRTKSHLLRFCEIVFKPIQPAAPAPKKLVIKMPSLMISEIPDVSPAKPKPKSSNSKPPSKAAPPKQPPPVETYPPVDANFAATANLVVVNLQNHPASAAFLLPVDESFAPMYFSLIKKPMDLSTVAKKLGQGAYKNNLDLLFADVQLIFANCYKYNTDDSPVSMQAAKLEAFFKNVVAPRALRNDLDIINSAYEEAEPLNEKPTATPEASDHRPLSLRAPDVPPIVPALPPNPIPIPQSTTPAVTTSRITPVLPKPEKSSKPSLVLKTANILAGTNSSAAVSESSSSLKPSSEVSTEISASKSDQAPTPSVSKPLPAQAQVAPVSQKIALQTPLPTAKPVIKLKTSETPTQPAAKPVSTGVKRKFSVDGGSAVSSAPQKVENVQKVASGIMSSEDYKKCKKIHRHLVENPKSFWFAEPVDAVGMGIPHYFDIIKEPMDLATLKTKMSTNSITTPKEFRRSAALIFKNAMTFNPENTQVHQDAKLLFELLKSEYARYFDANGQAVDNGFGSSSSLSKAEVAAVNVEPPAKKPKLKQAEPAASSVVVPAVSTGAEKKMLASSAAGKRCFKILRKLQASNFASVFKEPVDPVALGIPTYFNVIKHPMDLRTIQRKLEAGAYREPNDFKADVDLMLWNCATFNVPGDWVSQCGEGLQKVFQAEWNQIDWNTVAAPVPKAIGPIINQALVKLRAHQDALFFLEPVDPAILPDYHTKIKNPIDLGTMASKLDSGKYKSLEEFESDFKLLISNCYTYNPRGSTGHNCGMSLERYFKQIWKK